MANLIDALPLGPLLLGLAAYHPLQILMQTALRMLNPSLYATLAADRRRRLDPYFVFYAGILMTAFSTPYCLEAFSSEAARRDTDDFNIGGSSLTYEGKVCLGTRAVLWISELPLLSYSCEYALHHLLSLSALSVLLYRPTHVRGLYLIYAGLVTELLSDSVAIMRHHGLTSKNSTVYYHVLLANAVSIILVRAVPALACIGILGLKPLDTNDMPWIAPLIFYAGYVVVLSYKQLASLGLVKLSLSQRPAQVRLGGLNVPLFGVFFGAALAGAQLCTALIYGSSLILPLAETDIAAMSRASLESAIVGMAGARLLPMMVGRVSPRADLEADGNCAKFGISIQGGVFFTGLWAMCTQSLGAGAARQAMVASMLLSLPLGEAIGRIGCLTAGCCGSKQTAAVPSQLFSSLANLVGFVVLLIAVTVTSSLSLEAGGALALAYNGIVRFACDSYLRVDSTVVSQLLAALQVCLAGTTLAVGDFEEHFTAVKATAGMLLVAFGATYALLRTMIALKSSAMAWTMQPIVLASVAGASMTALAASSITDGLGTQPVTRTPTVGEQNIQSILGNTGFITCCVVSAVIPVVIREGRLDRCGS